MKILIRVLAITLFLVGCDKGGGSFSVLSESSTFEQTVTYVPRKLDVLFVIDNSGSMDNFQQQLGSNFSSFIDRFITKGYDFRIAVTTSEAYRYPQFALDGSNGGAGSCLSFCEEFRVQFRRGPDQAEYNPASHAYDFPAPTTAYVIDQANYDLSTVAGKNLLKSDFTTNVHVGAIGSGDERPFSSMIYALNYSTNYDSSPSPNRGFHRSDAFLAVVIVSDEEDFSQANYAINESYANPAIYSVASFKTALETFTGGQASTDFSVSTVSIMDAGCLTTLDPGGGIGRKISQRYQQLADLTGGTKNSLCQPFTTTLDNISSSIEGLSVAEFALTKTPILSSVRLVVRGTLVPKSDSDGWSYIALTKTLRINGSTYKPAAGDQIKLNFDPDLTNP